MPPVGARAQKPEPAEGHVSLRQKVIRGASWTILGALANKVASFVGQIVLAWLLVPEDFGLVALAGAVTGIATLLSAGGIQNVLIQRAARFREWAGQVFWLGLTLHVVAGLTVAGLSPFAGAVFHEPRVVPLILTAALSIPLASLNYVYSAKLYIDLRFRSITLIHLGEGVIQTALGIALAACGLGPYAIILPQVVVRLYSAAAFRLAAGQVRLETPAPSLWPQLISPGVWLMLYVCLIGFQSNAMFLVIGSFLDARSTGYFSWGYQVASQAVFLLVINLRQVLIPMVVKLNDQPERQRAAFYRGVGLMTVVALTVCLAQAAAAGPLVRWFFAGRWSPAVPVIVWMSLALATTPLNVFGSALLVGRAMNRAAALLVGSQALLVMAGAAAGGLVGDYLAVTYFVAGSVVVGNGLALLVAAKVLRRPGVRDLSAGVPLAPVSP